MNKDGATIYLARHGETEWNVKGFLQGQGDSPLTENGLAQAATLRDTLKNIHFEAIFSSDLLRAKRTAEIAALDRKLVVTASHLLRERNYGTFEGKTLEEYRQANKEMLEKREALESAERSKFKVAPDVETDDEIISRLLTFLREIAVTYPSKSILVVSHGGVMRALLHHLAWNNVAETRAKIKINNTAYIKLLADGTNFTIEKIGGIELIEQKKTPS